VPESCLIPKFSINAKNENERRILFTMVFLLGKRLSKLEIKIKLIQNISSWILDREDCFI
jgi:hypothetical protein